jgi:lipopolysaccharide transport system ATP-binding protein
MEIDQGDVVGIIGKNGAGKSTLLKILSKVTRPTTGTIKYRGRIASLLEVGTGFHAEMTGRENIYMNGAIMGMTRAEISRKLDEIVDFSGCERYLDTPVKRYSSGMTVRLGFAIAAHLDPEILVVDEVLAVGDAEFQKKAIGKMQDVSKDEGRTVLFVSHNMAAVKSLCKNGYVLGNGMIQKRGDINSCVDFYLSDLKSDSTPDKVITENYQIQQNRRVFFSRFTIEKGANFFYETEPLVFIIEVKANTDEKNCRINVSINSTLDVTIGCVLGDGNTFDMTAGETKKVRMTIPNHNLAVGTYYASFSIGTGGRFTTSMTDFDVKSQVFIFEIKQKNEHSRWELSWGNIAFPVELDYL